MATYTKQYDDGDARGTPRGSLMMGDDGTNIQSVKTDSDGNLQVDVLTMPAIAIDEFPAAAAASDNFANPTTTNVLAMGMLFDGSTWDRARGDSTDGALVNLGSNNDVTVTGSVTANAGTNLNTSALLTTSNFTDVFGTASLVTTTQADNVANTTDGVNTTTLNYWFDGSTWDRARGDATDGLLVNLGSNNDVTVTSGAITETNSGSILTAVQLIDDVIYTDDTSTHTAATTKVAGIGLVAAPTDTAVNANDIAMPGMSVGREQWTIIRDAAGNLRGANVNASGQLSVSVDANVSQAVTNAGTFAVQVDGAALTALQLIDDTVFTDDTSTHSTGSTKGIGIMAVAAPTDTAVNANDIGMPGMTVNRELYASITTALPAGTNNIGDVDVLSLPALPAGTNNIGDVDILSIAAGDNNIGNVDIASIAAGDNNIGNVDLASAIPAGANTIGAVTNVPLSNFGAGEYETVAASQTAQVLGATGAAGDYISGVLVVPASTSPGNVLLLDNATSITVFTGGASSVSNLVPFFIPLGMISVSGAWKLTTGANVSCIGIGNFT